MDIGANMPASASAEAVNKTRVALSVYFTVRTYGPRFRPEPDVDARQLDLFPNRRQAI